MEVVVVTGIGGMGLACARRLGSGRRLVLADHDAARLAAVATTLSSEGFDVLAQPVDVGDRDAVTLLAKVAAEAGDLRTLVHTAGLSPTMADARRIYTVDLLGTALVLDTFLPLAKPGTVAIVIASMAGSMAALDTELESKLALAPTADLLGLVAHLGADDPLRAYAVAKRGNQLRVEGAAPAWGARGARVASISPGIISTPMGRQERQSQPLMEHLLKISPVQRLGTAEDIAAAVEWLGSPAAGFVSGIDLRVDGGVIAALRQTSPSP